MDAGLIAAIATAAAAGTGGVVAWLTARRTASGRIGTSEAGVLWEQAQAMRAELVAQRDKAIEQRDRLIDAQSAQTGTALLAITESLRQINAGLADLRQALEQGNERPAR